MKKCNICKKEKPFEEFDWKYKAKGIKASRCIECRKEYSKKHYLKNKEVYIFRAKRDREKEKLKTKNLIMSLKIKCEKCDEDHPATLDFHHLDPNEKEFNISHATSRKAIIEEAKKCMVLCSNCHRKLHWG